MMKKVLKTESAPAAIGPYSQGISENGLLFLSGQIPLTPDGSSLTALSVDVQTRQVMENIGNLLEAEGLYYDDIIKTTIFLTEMDDFQTVNEIYGSYFKTSYPARSAVCVSKLPKNARVEIECVASRKE